MELLHVHKWIVIGGPLDFVMRHPNRFVYTKEVEMTISLVYYIVIQEHVGRIQKHILRKYHNFVLFDFPLQTLRTVQVRFTQCLVTKTFKKQCEFLLVMVFGLQPMTKRNPKSLFSCHGSHV